MVLSILTSSIRLWVEVLGDHLVQKAIRMMKVIMVNKDHNQG